MGSGHEKYAEGSSVRSASSKRRTGETSGRAEFHQTDDAFRGDEDLSDGGCMELFLRDPRCSGKRGLVQGNREI